MIQSTVYARVGLAGNPSDGFNGKTLSACVRNWSATVTLEPADRIIIQPNPDMDRMEFDDLESLTDHSEKYGYYGALRLIHATCSLFNKLTGDVDSDGFKISYISNIPRQVGLGGSSALVVALLNCLVERYDIKQWGSIENVSLSTRANIAWEVENCELGITSGLQDRVVQTYGGLVYMDFNKALMDKQGYGYYGKVGYRLPNAFIAYTTNPRKNSGQVHNHIRHLYQAGNMKVSSAMKDLAEIACLARRALEKKDYVAFGSLMNRNFHTRLELYGIDMIGTNTNDMIVIAWDAGCVAKLPGSGGAVVGLYDSEEQYYVLAKAYSEHGYECVKVIWDQ